MRRLTILHALFLILPLGFVTAQDAKQNFLKAQELYGSGQYYEAERLLLEAERQLGGPKVATTSLMILCQYKSNSFNSYDLLERVALLKGMNPETTDIYKEILQIENTVVSWKKDLDAKIATIIASQDLAAAKAESDKNYKIKDYNVTFDKLYEEIQSLKVSPGWGSSYRDWYTAIANLKTIEIGSRFGYQSVATEKIASLEQNLMTKIVSDKYPDEGERLYRDLLRNSQYYGDVIRKTQERRDTEARVAEEKRLAELKKAEEKRLAEQKKKEEIKQGLLKTASDLDQKASGYRVLGGTMFLGGLASAGLGVYLYIDILSRDSTQDTSVFEYIASGAGIGLGYALAKGGASQLEKARSLKSRADSKRQEAQRYGTSILPVFGVNKDGHVDAGFSLRLNY